jgi:hypothetical protein
LEVSTANDRGSVLQVIYAFDVDKIEKDGIMKAVRNQVEKLRSGHWSWKTNAKLERVGAKKSVVPIYRFQVLVNCRSLFANLSLLSLLPILMLLQSTTTASNDQAY